jgi:RNA polymerase sigma-70 factor (ECF subfamily)
VNPGEVTSWSVILGAATGAPLEREAFAQRYAPVIRAYLAARWRVPPDHADVADATNEAFVECFKEGGALQRVDPTCAGGFRAFLYGVVRNVALMAERKHARRRDAPGPIESDLDALAARGESLSRVFDRAWAESVVLEARTRIAERSRRSPAATQRFLVLTMRFEQNLPPRDIAAALQVPVERVYEWLRQARTEFRTALIEVMARCHPGCSEAEVERLCVELLSSLR